MFRVTCGVQGFTFTLMLVLVALFGSGIAWADTLVLKDGRKITGEVTETGNGYRVLSRGIGVTFDASDVHEWIKGGDSTRLAQPAPAPALPAAGPATAPAGVKADAEATAKSINLLLGEGREALAAGDFVTGRSRFLDALDLDDKQVDALHGLALCQLGLGDRKKAEETIDRAMAQVEKRNLKPARALVLNFATIQLATANPMRAGKYLVDYMERQPRRSPADEAMANVLGSAWWNSPMRASGASSPLYTRMGTLYDSMNLQLEALEARGAYRERSAATRRWGVRWVSRAEFEQLSMGLERLEDARLQTVNCSRAVTNAKRVIEEARMRALMARGPAGEYDRAMRTYQDAVADYQEQYAVWRKLLDTTEFPQFPKVFATVPMDQDVPPAEIAGDALEPRSVTAIIRPRGERVVEAENAAPAAIRVTVAKVDENTPPPLGNARPLLLPPRVVVPRLAGHRTIRRYAVAIPVAPNVFLTTADLVQGAKRITLRSLTDDTLRATVRTTDPNLGLALLDVPQAKNIVPVKLANDAANGPVQCVGLAASVFESKIELIDGTLRLAQTGATVSMRREVRRPGSPIIKTNEVVGVVLADRSANVAVVPVATSTQIRAFIGPELSVQAGPFAVPQQIIYEADSEVEVE